MFNHTVAVVQIGLGRHHNRAAFIGGNMIGPRGIACRIERHHVPCRLRAVIPAHQPFAAADGHFSEVLRRSARRSRAQALHGQPRAVRIGIGAGINRRLTARGGTSIGIHRAGIRQERGILCRPCRDRRHSQQHRREGQQAPNGAPRPHCHPAQVSGQ